jgi:hypothetical protein
MAEYSYPFENVDVTEDQFFKWASTLQLSGVKWGLNPTVSSSSMSFTVSAGEAFVNGGFYSLTSSMSFVLESSGSSFRRDYLALELNSSSNTIELKILKGTPNTVVGSASVPNLSRTNSLYQLPLVEFLINPVGSGTLLESRDVRVFTGSPIGSWFVTPTLVDGQVGYNRTLDVLEYKSVADSTVRSIENARFVPTAPTNLLASHRSKTLRFENAAATTFTLSPVFSVGERFDWVNLGTGQVTFVAESGASLRSARGVKTNGQYSVGSVIRLSATEWLLVGDLTS